jgi:hypothetical protein
MDRLIFIVLLFVTLASFFVWLAKKFKNTPKAKYEVYANKTLAELHEAKNELEVKSRLLTDKKELQLLTDKIDKIDENIKKLHN